MSLAHDGTEVNENIFTVIAGDKTKALACAEPLHAAGFLGSLVYGFAFLLPRRLGGFLSC